MKTKKEGSPKGEKPIVLEPSQAIVVAERTGISTAVSFETMSREQIDLIKRTVAKGATDDELRLFVHKCGTMSVDPLDKLVHFTKYTNQKTGETTVAFISSIDFFRSRAFSTGLVDGISVELVRDAKGGIYSAVATLHRKDMKFPVVAEALFAEYNTGRRNWASMPSVMIKKCAEVMVYRMAFADALHGVYIREEMDQAEGVEKDYQSATPPSRMIAKPAVVVEAVNYSVVPKTKSGALDGKKWTEVPLEDLKKFLKHYEDRQVDKEGNRIEASVEYYRAIAAALLDRGETITKVSDKEALTDSLEGSRSDPSLAEHEKASAAEENFALKGE